MTIQDFSDIAPFDNSNVRQQIASMVNQPEFEHAMTWMFPGIDYAAFKQQMLQLQTQEEFQTIVMKHFLEVLAERFTDGLSAAGLDNIESGKAYTMISNHRDIVLDASFLNLSLMRGGLPTSEIAIGNNLLIMPWIDQLVRINRSFIVKRDNGVRGALEAAKHLSSYIHFCILDKKNSLWIAQREGRAKDSDDRTQDSLIKMLMLGAQPGKTPLQALKEVNLMPVAISYEYDPNDYLKAQEFLLKRRDPDFKKSPKDDLRSMETGLTQHKGRIHYCVSECINDRIDALDQSLDRAGAAHAVADIIDRAIHRHYRLYPINYVAYDLLEGEHRFGDQYTHADVQAVRDRIDSQLAKCRVENITPEEMDYMKRMMLTMYANPLKNKLF